MRHHDVLTKIRHAAETGQKRLDLTSMGLTTLPPELAGLDNLETLDLSGNALEDLPDFLAGMPGLKHLFLTKNRFVRWPGVVARMPGLEMISFKSNRLTRLPETGLLPAGLRWLILTDNRLESLPYNFGQVLPRLRKLALAGNRLRELPASFAALEQLELLRLGMNRLVRRPAELEALPRLSWLGLGGNPYCSGQEARHRAHGRLAACRLDPARFRLGDQLGSGASGTVYRAEWLDHPKASWAVKQFREVSADGHPDDELAVAAIAAVEAPGIIPFRGWWPEGGMALVMDYLDQAAPLGQVPSFETITRDCYPAKLRLETRRVRRMLASLARAQEHLIACRVIHGDFYAHNVLATPDGEVKLGDWGASFFFDSGEEWMERMEVRAFGCLMEELLALGDIPAPDLAELCRLCLSDDPAARPSFAQLAVRLGAVE